MRGSRQQRNRYIVWCDCTGVIGRDRNAKSPSPFLTGMSGGAIQQNWRVDVLLDEQRAELVLRTDGRSTLAVSHSREQEFALLRAAFAAGVTVAEPLWCCSDSAVIGAPFFIRKRVAGTAAPARILRDPRLGG